MRQALQQPPARMGANKRPVSVFGDAYTTTTTGFFNMSTDPQTPSPQTPLGQPALRPWLHLRQRTPTESSSSPPTYNPLPRPGRTTSPTAAQPSTLPSSAPTAPPSSASISKVEARVPPPSTATKAPCPLGRPTRPSSPSGSPSTTSATRTKTPMRALFGARSSRRPIFSSSTSLPADRSPLTTA
jgi:hypothetical protein